MAPELVGPVETWKAPGCRLSWWQWLQSFVALWVQGRGAFRREPRGGVGWGSPCRKRAAQACLGPVLEPLRPQEMPQLHCLKGALYLWRLCFLICVLGAETPTVHDERMLTTTGH